MTDNYSGAMSLWPDSRPRPVRNLSIGRDGAMPPPKDRAVDLQQQAGDRSLADWISWAEQRVSDVDPLNHGPMGVFKKVVAVMTWDYAD